MKNNISNIPIYRGLKIGENEYVEGYYYKDNREHIIFNGDSTTVFGLRVIDPTTLSIHFPDMLDSQGNRIFASLQESGKGGDILETEQKRVCTVKYNEYFFYADNFYADNKEYHCNCFGFIHSKVIGIQQ